MSKYSLHSSRALRPSPATAARRRPAALRAIASRQARSSKA